MKLGSLDDFFEWRYWAFAAHPTLCPSPYAGPLMHGHDLTSHAWTVGDKDQVNSADRRI